MASTLPTPSSCCSLCDGLTVEIVTTVVPSGGNAGIFVAETLATLRTLEPATTNRYAVLLGNLVKYDFGPAKTYYWDASSAEADDPYSVVVPNIDLGVGRWIEVT